MSVELLVTVAAGLLSLAVAYVPGLKQKWEQLEPADKARWMAVALIVVTLGIFALACANLLVLFGLEVACTAASGVQLLQLLIFALMANQTTFSLLVKPFKK